MKVKGVAFLSLLLAMPLVGMEGHSPFFRCPRELFAAVIRDHQARRGGVRRDQPPLQISTPRLEITLVQGGYEKVATVKLRETGAEVGKLIVFPKEPGQITIHVKEFSVQKQGYATEAKYHLMKTLFQSEDLKKIVEVIDPHRVASVVLHTKLGFKQIDDEHWEITAADFHALEKKLADDPDFARDFFTARSYQGAGGN